MGDKKTKKADGVEKVQEYFDKYNEIIDFVIGRKIVKEWLFKFSLIAALIAGITFFSFNGWIKSIASQKVNEYVGGAIQEDVDYLRAVNNIAKIAAKATASGDIRYYNEVKNIIEIAKDEDDIFAKMELIDMVSSRREMIVPEYLLKIAKGAKHIKELQASLLALRYLFNAHHLDSYSYK